MTVPRILRETGADVRGSITESAASTERQPRYRARILSPGWGSSGHYAEAAVSTLASTLAAAGKTRMYLDHPTKAEAQARPERSIRDLAAWIDPGTVAVESDGVYADVVPFPHAAELISSLYSGDLLDVSIRADGTSHFGEAEGRQGPIIDTITKVHSVDFVTKAGRGGHVVAKLVESMRQSPDAEIVEATVNDLRERLDRAVRDAYNRPGAGVYAGLRDFDEQAKIAYYETGDRTYAQPYETSDYDVTLTGTPTEVRAVTTFVPVAPGGVAESTREENSVTETQNDELRESAARAERAERELAEARAELAKARTDATRTTVAAKLAEATRTLPKPMADRVTGTILAAISETIPADLDAQVTAAVEAEKAYIKQVAESEGGAKLTGFGASTTPITTAVAESAGEQLAGFWKENA